MLIKLEIILNYTGDIRVQDIESWPRGYITFFMLNSVEHEISNVHKYKSIKKFSLFQTQI